MFLLCVYFVNEIKPRTVFFPHVFISIHKSIDFTLQLLNSLHQTKVSMMFKPPERYKRYTDVICHLTLVPVLQKRRTCWRQHTAGRGQQKNRSTWIW